MRMHFGAHRDHGWGGRGADGSGGRQRHGGDGRDFGGRHFGGPGGRHGADRSFGGEEGRGGGRRRVFDSGELRLVLLKLIADQPRHGYDLIRAIEELTNGAYAPSPGVVYPTVTMLQDMDQIEEQKAQGTRRLYAVTDAGAAVLEERSQEVAMLFARLAKLGAMREKTDSAPIRRAMINLKMALHNRLSQGEIPNETLHEVAGLIDEAARRIERYTEGK